MSAIHRVAPSTFDVESIDTWFGDVTQAGGTARSSVAEAPAQHFEDAGIVGLEGLSRFGQGLLGAADSMTLEPLRQIVDLGTIGASFVVNGLRQPGDPLWLPDLHSHMAQAHVQGATPARLLLQSLPVVSTGVASYDMTTALLEGRSGDAWEALGGLAGGLTIGAGVQKSAGYGFTLDDIGAHGPMKYQAGAIKPRIDTPQGSTGGSTAVEPMAGEGGSGASTREIRFGDWSARYVAPTDDAAGHYLVSPESFGKDFSAALDSVYGNFHRELGIHEKADGSIYYPDDGHLNRQLATHGLAVRVGTRESTDGVGTFLPFTVTEYADALREGFVPMGNDGGSFFHDRVAHNPFLLPDAIWQLGRDSLDVAKRLHSGIDTAMSSASSFRQTDWLFRGLDLARGIEQSQLGAHEYITGQLAPSNLAFPRLPLRHSLDEHLSLEFADVLSGTAQRMDKVTSLLQGALPIETLLSHDARIDLGNTLDFASDVASHARAQAKEAPAMVDRIHHLLGND